MNILCIGPHKEGSTTKMRSSIIPQVIEGSKVHIIDTDISSNKTNRLFRSLGWRTARGPLVTTINQYIISAVKNKTYDIIWVDKGTFIRPEVIKLLKSKTKKLVHYTPDTAFLCNKSHLFNQSIPYYDFLITTKTFELSLYEKYGAKEVIYCTQGFDHQLHKSTTEVATKSGVVFLGRYEPNRAKIIQQLIDQNIKTVLGGSNWDRFYKKNKQHQHLNYLGTSAFGEAYAKNLSAGQIGLGLLSKLFPEKHTTRTFEIPACGTALLTERNEETVRFFKEDEVIFFNKPEEIVPLVKSNLADPKKLQRLSQRGTDKVLQGGFDYQSIMKNVLEQVMS